MRVLPAALTAILEGGDFTGLNRPNGYVTVEPDWWLNTTTAVGNWPVEKRPLRWWQRAANDQVEIPVPNITMIQTDGQLDQAARSATITMKNLKMRPNIPAPGTPPPTSLGMRGYYGATYGNSQEAMARWGHTMNEWNDVLVQGALFRTYEGYGGWTAGPNGEPVQVPLADALDGGFVVLSGVWIVDDVKPNSRGDQVFACRDTAALLVDQELIWGLIPNGLYPLLYHRWTLTNVGINAHDITTTTSTTTQATPGPRTAVYVDSSENRWYPAPDNNPNMHGHFPSEANDGNTDTYWMSVGNAGPNYGFSFVWLEYDLGGQAVNAVYINPADGGYQCFVSVLENGAWQGAEVIPYDFSTLPAQTPRVDIEANIPFVTQGAVGVESPTEIMLPRVYTAQRIRVTFTNLAYTDYGEWHYRAMVREFEARVSAGAPGGGTTTTTTTAPAVFYAADNIRNPADLNQTGYITVSIFRQVDAFGDARIFPVTGGDPPCNHEVLGVVLTAAADGYRIMCDHGHITCYGNAPFYGSPYPQRNAMYHVPGGQIVKAGTLLNTPTGLGYWVLGWEGTIYSYGDAAAYAPLTPPAGEFFHSAAAHPATVGLWALATNGTVQVLGTAVDYGDYTESVVSNVTQAEIAIDIEPTMASDGYWILTSAGRVQALGAAVDYGDHTDHTQSTDSLLRTYQLLGMPSDLGYLILDGNGVLDLVGTVDYFGSPAAGTAELRSDGNYRFYEDIIKDLVLWSGFLFQRVYAGNEPPDVFGAIESTGAYANEPLDPAIFDKRPVIDAINTLAEIVAYEVGCDETGAFFFKSPNIWSSGNFIDGVHTDIVPEIDERTRLTDYAALLTKKPVRSRIIVSSIKIDPNDSTQEYVDYVPHTARYLRGMIKPAMWVDAHFISRQQQQIMAELIALRIWFAVRAGQLTAWTDPRVQLDDQVRILERTTSETYIHRVRGKSTSNDIVNGVATMQLTTNWLGDASHWAITADHPELDQFQVSGPFLAYLQGSSSTHVAAAAAAMTPSGTGTTTPVDPSPPPPVPVGGSGPDTGFTVKDRLGFSPGAMHVTESGGAMNADTALADATGGTWIRLDAFDTGNANLDAAVDAAHAAGMNVLIIINTGSSSPAAYVAACNTLVTRYLARGVTAFELGNEPNNPTGFGGGTLTATSYSALVKAAYPAIKAHSASITVAAGALSPGTGLDDPVAWVHTMYAEGCKGYFDVLSIHPYCYPNLPSQSASWSTWTKMLQVHDYMVFQNDNKPIWATEFGVPTNATSEAFQTQSLQDAAAQMSGLPWLGLLLWYSIRDSGTSGGDDQQNFGLVKNDGTTHKTGYAAYGAL